MPKQILQTITDERSEPGRIRRSLTFRLGDQEAAVPAILQLPAGRTRSPAALLVHGYGASKELMADTIGHVLVDHGIASLAVDLPLHGQRGDAGALRGPNATLAVLREWRAALAEGALALRYLGAHAAVDGSRLATLGYSLGSYVALKTAGDNAAVRAVVVAAGGDLPTGTPFARLVRLAADPLGDVRRLGGRPFLMVHGRHDRVVLPEQAERLYEAAREPKDIHWWDAGHYLPEAAIDRAASWLAARLAA